MAYTPSSDEERDFLAAYDPSGYPRIEVTVDLFYYSVRDEECVLLIKRGGYPYRGCWALPGGFVNPDETLAAAAARECAEETGIENLQPEFFAAFDDPDRDPRGRVISMVHLVMDNEGAIPTPGDDATEARWWPLSALPENLAFDHRKIIDDVTREI